MMLFGVGSLKIFIRFTKYVSVISLIIFFLTSCVTSTDSKKTVLLTFIVAQDLNPDVNQRPSPVALTFYQLSNSSSFRKADYLSLAENSNAVLGRDLLVVNTLILQPGQTLTVNYPVSEHEAAFGLLAGYRVIDTSGWQLVYEYPRDKTGFWSSFNRNGIFDQKILVGKNRIQFDSSSNGSQ